MLRHYQSHIPVVLLGISTTEYPELKLKAFTNRIMVAYLAVCLQDACASMDAPPGRLVLACAAMQKLSRWLLDVENAGRYMTAKEADDLYTLTCEHLASIDF